jgi:hypothetical protein
VTALFDRLKTGNTNQTNNEAANERLKNITVEAEKVAKDVQEKIQQIDGKSQDFKTEPSNSYPGEPRGVPAFVPHQQ